MYLRDALVGLDPEDHPHARAVRARLAVRAREVRPQRPGPEVRARDLGLPELAYAADGREELGVSIVALAVPQSVG